MEFINNTILTQLKLPAKDSHKGANGKLTIIGGSKLFHGSPLLALSIASRIVDMVYFVSADENLELVKDLKSNLNTFIAVPFGYETDYIKQSDAVLIGPGMVRGETGFTGTGESGVQTRERVLKLLEQFPEKQWILDAGALQAVTAKEVFNLGVKNPIVTPHRKEFVNFFELGIMHDELGENIEDIAKIVQQQADKYNCIIVLKGKIDIVSDGKQVLFNQTGNEGMTKGGTGDVLAGLIASLATINNPLTATAVGAYINGLAGDKLYKTVGPYFNADELAKKVSEVLWEQLIPQALLRR